MWLIDYIHINPRGMYTVNIHFSLSFVLLQGSEKIISYSVTLVRPDKGTLVLWSRTTRDRGRYSPLILFLFVYEFSHTDDELIEVRNK